MPDRDSATKQSPTHVRLSDDTTWPLPDLREDGLAWRLTYGVQLSSAETARAASIITQACAGGDLPGEQGGSGRGEVHEIRGAQIGSDRIEGGER